MEGEPVVVHIGPSPEGVEFEADHEAGLFVR